ncbi:hypothetical protein K438DRAFT_1754115 [Mycena galopus ATCC 62051]|nr:hypothetical protein K438DRAFT_1754115 [Mycena galopus ATCC 62051]
MTHNIPTSLFRKPISTAPHTQPKPRPFQRSPHPTKTQIIPPSLFQAPQWHAPTNWGIGPFPTLDTSDYLLLVFGGIRVRAARRGDMHGSQCWTFGGTGDTTNNILLVREHFAAAGDLTAIFNTNESWTTLVFRDSSADTGDCGGGHGNGSTTSCGSGRVYSSGGTGWIELGAQAEQRGRDGLTGTQQHGSSTDDGITGWPTHWGHRYDEGELRDVLWAPWAAAHDNNGQRSSQYRVHASGKTWVTVGGHHTGTAGGRKGCGMGRMRGQRQQRGTGWIAECGVHGRLGRVEGTSYGRGFGRGTRRDSTGTAVTTATVLSLVMEERYEQAHPTCMAGLGFRASRAHRLAWARDDGGTCGQEGWDFWCLLCEGYLGMRCKARGYAQITALDIRGYRRSFQLYRDKPPLGSGFGFEFSQAIASD